MSVLDLQGMESTVPQTGGEQVGDVVDEQRR